MSEVRLDFSELTQESQDDLLRSFFYGPDGFKEYMKRPEVQERYREWQRLRKEASAASAPAMA